MTKFLQLRPFRGMNYGNGNPQSAPISWLIEGYKKANDMKIQITDDMHAIELLTKKIAFLEPGYANPKITHVHDLKYISLLMNHE